MLTDWELAIGSWREQFEASPLVARLQSGAQFCQLANMIYQNAEENPTEVQKALFLWRKAMDKVRNPLACVTSRHPALSRL